MTSGSVHPTRHTRQGQPGAIGDPEPPPPVCPAPLCATGAIGLTTLYNQVDEGAYAELKALHRKLDEAVVGAYGWPRAAAHDSDVIVQQLLELNREISTGKRRYDPFGTQAASAMNELPMQDLSVEHPSSLR